MTLLQQTVIFLGAAIVVAPVFKKLGLGSVLGYLAAGILIGPAGFGWIGEIEQVRQFAEFGVVMLLFVIGLELKISRLSLMRRTVFGLGSAQVVITVVLISLIASLAGLPLQTALVVGVALAMSSTSFALQLLSERQELSQAHGRASFGVLLFQVLFAIPLLAAVPLLSPEHSSTDPLWLSLSRAVGVLLLVLVIARYLLRHLLRQIAIIRSQEMMTAVALFVVTGTAVLMELAGLSMALGAFLAGILLADSEFRHQLEADIEPFKSLLLGLFFIAIGMTFQWTPIVENPWLVIALTFGLLALKGIILVVLGRLFSLTKHSAIRLAAVLSHGGGFTFVIFITAVAAGIMSQSLSNLLMVVAILSMMLTPPLMLLADSVLRKSVQPTMASAIEADMPDDNPIIIAGFGRFGQIVARILAGKRIPFTALDSSFAHINFLRKFGNRVYFGDATRLELLRAAGADDAKLLLIAIDDFNATLTIARLCREHFPQLKVMARARNRQHVYQLMEADVAVIKREVLGSSLEMALHVLMAHGIDNEDAERTVRRFKAHDEERIQRGFHHWEDEEKMRQSALQAVEELQKLFEEDAKEQRS